MSTEVLHRFDNTPFGGSHNITLTGTEMPNWYPVGEDAKINTIRADTGRAWRYPWYRKYTYALSFDSVGTHIAATMGSIAQGGVEFLWYRDVDSDSVATGTFVYIGEFEQRPFAPNLTDFSFRIRDKG